MKMNSLEALFEVIEKIQNDKDIQSFEPKKYGALIDDRTIASMGGEPILFMRHFQRTGVMSPSLLALVQD